MNHSTWDDEQLIAGVVAAQAECLGVLYDRYGRLVFSLAVRVLNDDGLAEEVTQDVFVLLWNKAFQYHAEQGKVITWLTRMARNRAIDVLRRRSVRPEGHQVGWADGISPDLQDPVEVEPQVVFEQERRRVIAAIEGLPVEQRRVLALAYYQGLSHHEIAEALQEPLGTVKTRLRLAMQKLRQALEHNSVAAP
ncbi:MAG TPA: sigma-70 family RNA polymerase sigma factor [Anaerolineaceae bacterium]